MFVRSTVFWCLLWALSGSLASAQVGESPLRIFGYFQSDFRYQFDERRETTETTEAAQRDRTSFSVQQLNLFAQKDLTSKWTALVNIEFVNSYFSRRWGTLSLEEVWVRYRPDHRFHLKLGLQIPIFNNLNEIKNRTPLLPYIVRPLVYEKSFAETISLEEYLPTRAYIQTFGFLRLGQAKVDYAFYVGNSPNVLDLSTEISDLTGVDTSATILVGGRLGLRWNELGFLTDLKVGGSASHDYANLGRVMENVIPSEYWSLFQDQLGDLVEVPRIRLGADFSFRVGRFFFEGEVISVQYRESLPSISFDKAFLYGTLGYDFSEQVSAYVSYWRIDETILDADQEAEVPTVGVAYRLLDRLILKMQWARANISFVDPGTFDPELKTAVAVEQNYLAVAVTVWF